MLDNSGAASQAYINCTENRVALTLGVRRVPSTPRPVFVAAHDRFEEICPVQFRQHVQFLFLQELGKRKERISL